ncbi:LysR family transcriptional regulator [Ornithinimicrobium cavernae]|uniref:LysR family transcriptional regulator n=1 Tax=Ornithinimicrobium cavernae TaxID=2666047 RepID=UPI000D68DCCB|nr:LysR family transcriptional regulator [Ornithinimicrobium cavernae]
MIDPHKLRVWRAVVASGSIQAAARHLGYTPSTISQHVQQLQRETRLVLTERVGRGLQPTAAGLTLATEAEQVLNALQRLNAVVIDLREGRAHELAISCAASVAQEWIPTIARRLQESLPGIVLAVNINEPHEGPGRRTPDIIVRSVPVQDEPAPPEGHQRHELRVEDFVVVLPVDSPLAAQEVVRLGELADAPWIDNLVYEGNPTMEILLRACGAAGFAPRWSARCDDHRAASGLVATGIGVTALPALAARQLPADTVARRLVDPTPQRRLVAWQRTSTAHTTASRLALGALQDLALG